MHSPFRLLAQEATQQRFLLPHDTRFTRRTYHSVTDETLPSFPPDVCVYLPVIRHSSSTLSRRAQQLEATVEALQRQLDQV